MSHTRTYPIEASDLKRLDRQRSEITRLLSPEDLAGSYSTAMGKLATLKIILETGVFGPNHTHELQCLGVILGDVFVQELNFRWIMVSDELGITPAITHNNNELTFFPLTMISKRIERGETVDITALYKQLSGKIKQLISEQDRELCEV